MKKTLKKHIQEHYLEFELSPGQLADLNQMPKNRGKRKRFRFPAKLSLAALASLFLFLGIFSLFNKESIVIKIVEEVAYNHSKNVPIEIKTTSIEQIQNYLNKTDFTLIRSEKLPQEEWELIGGRYCSIQGRLAVQMKVKDKAGKKLHTLYQAPFPKDLDEITALPVETYINGIRVNLWKEKGLLLALAGG